MNEAYLALFSMGARLGDLTKYMYIVGFRALTKYFTFRTQPIALVVALLVALHNTALATKNLTNYFFSPSNKRNDSNAGGAFMLSLFS